MTIKTYIVAAVVASALLVGLSCKYIFKQSNSPVEKVAEKIIEEETGVQVDFNASDSNLLDNRNALLKKLADRVEERSTASK